MFRRHAVAVLFAALLAAAPFAVVAKDVVLHVAPGGSDSATGTDRQQALRSFARALKLARETAGADDDVTVRFAAGSYGAATLEIDWFPGGRGKLILDGSSPEGRAAFDGGRGPTTWLVIRGRRDATTNIVVRDFVVRNYRGAIAFYGDRFDAVPWSRGNRIEGNLFENIGQLTKEVKPAFAAITVTNSHDNVFVRNRFKNIVNVEKCDGLHAIYLSGGSSRNRIAENVFDGGCGDTIKARDRSNDNEIRDNEFLNQTGKSIFVDSFCDGTKIAECADKKQECPSWGNEFAGNKVDATSRQSVKAITRTVGRAEIAGCPLPRSAAARIVERDEPRPR
jgi:putative intracellular protease/amidase